MRVIPLCTHESRHREGEMRFQPTRPMRTFDEVGTLLGISAREAEEHHRVAVIKIRAALSAWGYHKERE